MATLAWWSELDGVTQGFFVAAAFFSVFFVWQLIATLIGLGGHEDADVDVDADIDYDAGHDAYEHFEQGAMDDAHATVAAFRVLSIRSIVAFCTLFSWAGALYLNEGRKLPEAMGLAILWGTGAMLAVAAIFYMMRKLTETGTPRLATCVGANGTVYLDIPAGGIGEVRVPVSGVQSHVRARCAGQDELKMGTPVRVRRLLNSTTVEVEPGEPGGQAGSEEP